MSCRKCEKVVLAGGVLFKSLFFVNATITVSKEHLTWRERCDIAGSFHFQRVPFFVANPPNLCGLSSKDSDFFFNNFFNFFF